MREKAVTFALARPAGRGPYYGEVNYHMTERKISDCQTVVNNFCTTVYITKV